MASQSAASVSCQLTNEGVRTAEAACRSQNWYNWSTWSYDREISASFAKAVEAAGVSDEDFDCFFQEVREDVWQENQRKHKRDESS
jgi:hypothetical protein